MPTEIPAGTVCLACGEKPAVTNNNGTTVPMCSGCNSLRSNPRGVKMTKGKRGSPK